MKAVLLLISLFLFKPTDYGCAKLDIIILADMSQSVQGYEDYIREASETFINRFELSEDGIQIGLIVFNSRVTVLSSITDNKSELLRDIQYISIGTATSNTDLSAGLQSTMGEFLEHNRPNSGKIIIIISDGKPNDPNDALKKVNDAKLLLNCTVFGILVKTLDSDGGYMESLSSPNCYIETNYQMLADELNKLDICL